MTTTHMFSGMNPEGKNSSRVLQHPGGGASNIFGQSEDPKPRVLKKAPDSNIFGDDAGQPEEGQQRSSKTYESSNVISQDPEPYVRAKPPQTNTHANLFGEDMQEATEPRRKQKGQATVSKSEERVDPQIAAEERRATVKKMTACTYNPITCETFEGYVEDRKTPSKRLHKVEQSGSYNLISHESYENGDEGKGDVPSTKVRHPPGGASTKLW